MNTSLLIGLYVVDSAVLWLCHHIYQAVTAQVRDQAAANPELTALLRPTLEDIAQQDPTIGEPIQLALAELDRIERRARLVDGGKYFPALFELRQRRRKTP